MIGWVYILKLGSGKYYVGSTTNLKERLKWHTQGLSNFTSKFLPLKLIFDQQFGSHRVARRAEMWLKQMKDRSIIEKVVTDGVIRKKF